MSSDPLPTNVVGLDLSGWRVESSIGRTGQPKLSSRCLSALDWRSQGVCYQTKDRGSGFRPGRTTNVSPADQVLDVPAANCTEPRILAYYMQWRVNESKPMRKRRTADSRRLLRDQRFSTYQ